MSVRSSAAEWLPGWLRQRLFRGVSWNLLASLFNQGSTLVVTLLVANLLGREDFGRFATVQTTLLTVSMVAQLAAGYTTTKYVAEFRSTSPARAASVLALCGAVSLATAALASFGLAVGARTIAAGGLHAPELATPLRYAAAGVFFVVLNGFLTGALVGLEAFAALGRVAIVAGITYVAFCWGGAWRYGIAGVVAGVAASAAIQWLLLAVQLLRELEHHAIPRAGIDIFAERRILLRFALPAALSGFSSMPALWLASAVLVRQPHGFSEMAMYSAANNLRALVLVVPSIVNGVVISLMNHQKGAGDDARYRTIYRTNLAIIGSLVFVSGVFMIAVGPYVLRIFGPGFAGGRAIIAALMASALVEAVGIAAYLVMQSKERMWLSLLAVIFPRDLLIVCITFVLAPRYGAVGLALASVIGSSVALVVIFAITRQLGVGVGESARGGSAHRSVMVEKPA